MLPPEIEKALASTHAQKLTQRALQNHSGDLAAARKKDATLGYPEAASAKQADERLIDEVLVPALDQQTGLNLDSQAELTAWLARKVMQKFGLMAGILAEDEDGFTVPADRVLPAADKFASDLAAFISAVAERAHHDGLTARELQPGAVVMRAIQQFTI